MPVYEYQCDKCGEIIEEVVFLGSEIPEPIPCPKCDGHCKRILSTFRYGMGRGGQAVRLR